MKKLLTLLIVLTLFVSSFPAMAQNDEVKVKIAPFYTEIQYMSVDNRYVEFPLITYKDITYFPMTFDLCARLGLMCGFDSGKGLFITREYVDYYTETPNYFGGDALNYYDKLYDAVIPTYPIYLNGIYIDNTKEKYPLINFRGITYFPMTWRFAYEELNFDIEWSEKDYSFKLYEDGKSNPPYAYTVDGNIVKLENKISVYDESINENGDTRYTLLYSYYANYDFDTAAQKVFRKEDTEFAVKRTQMPAREDKVAPTSLEATIKDKGIYVGDTLLMTLEGEEIVNVSTVNEYKTGDSTLIYLSVQVGNAPAPYTQYRSYFFRKDENGIKQIPWDARCNFNAVYEGVNGEFYVTSNSYRPAYSGRWSNRFSDIYLYKEGADEFQPLTEKHKDLFNSMYALGKEDGKIYFLGMWYDAQKENPGQGGYPPFSTVNGGYYTLDVNTGEITKLYPYICGETFFGPDGNLYCISNSSRIPRIVNLNTGKLIPIE
ncbi:MAG: hypothetical protein IJD91_02265 [Clostridia bacterium]|nr:hypothetical protein [Clostridia bacterium]